MSAVAATTPRRIPLAVPAAVAAAWLVAAGAETTGNAARLHHDALIEGGPPLWVALPIFLVAWQVMLAAMMVPSSVPLIRLFAAASRGQERPQRAMAGFLGGYVVVWTFFGAWAFMGDVAVHHTVDSWGWLHAHQWLIAGGVLANAGLFQYSSLKERCLKECRHPAQFLMRYYRRGTGAAFRLGGNHGLFCLGCCWALMLLMFAIGVAHITWMAALTALMVYEKTGRHGRGVAQVAGVVLLVWSGLVFAQPHWLPSELSGLH